MVQSCHEAVLQTIVFERFCPSLPLTLIFSGSNNCENSFSECGGYYRGCHGKRNYDVLDYVNYADNEFVMHLLEAAGISRFLTGLGCEIACMVLPTFDVEVATLGVRALMIAAAIVKFVGGAGVIGGMASTSMSRSISGRPS